MEQTLLKPPTQIYEQKGFIFFTYENFQKRAFDAEFPKSTYNMYNVDWNPFDPEALKGALKGSFKDDFEGGYMPDGWNDDYKGKTIYIYISEPMDINFAMHRLFDFFEGITLAFAPTEKMDRRTYNTFAQFISSCKEIKITF